MKAVTKLSYPKKLKRKVFNLKVFKRKMIAALIERPLTKREISQIMKNAYPDETPNNNSVRTNRFLKDLVAFNLIYDEDERGKYVWKIMTKDNIDMRAHSRQLIPAFMNLADMIEGRYTYTSQEMAHKSTANMNFLMSCAEDHLRIYPDNTWLLLKDYRKRKRATEDMKENFIARLKMSLSDFLVKTPLIESDSSADIIPELIYRKLMYGHSDTLDFAFKSLAVFIEKETKDINNLFEIVQVKNSQLDTTKAREKLEDKIRVLIFGIDAGRELSRGCKICAKDPLKELVI